MKVGQMQLKIISFVIILVITLISINFIIDKNQINNDIVKTLRYSYNNIEDLQQNLNFACELDNYQNFVYLNYIENSYLTINHSEICIFTKNQFSFCNKVLCDPAINKRINLTENLKLNVSKDLLGYYVNKKE